ncbi:MAG TPA: prephenate dehydrogenase/arogenate dehydrogenase family protein [Burkholderiaceae bacterium]|nr:prephenate dehydrogenase/arogenate dehydrogenase family protein [Burkholderiaceae bacterium]
MFDKVAIFGVGLIGGSLALALDRAGAAKRIVGIERSPGAAQRALQLGVVDEIARNEADAVRGADMVVLATPVAQTDRVLAAIAPHLTLRTIVTDTGSTKGNVIEVARERLGGKWPQFVPAHPIAGKEQAGVDAAEVELFDGRRCVLVPEVDTAGHAVEAVRDMWTACGALVSLMTAEQHDTVFAAVSHLPHLLSFALVAAIAREDDAAMKFAHAGGGFRDFTRIAASSPEMWRDIFIANKTAVLSELTAYEAELRALRQMIESNDAKAIEAECELSRNVRSQLMF